MEKSNIQPENLKAVALTAASKEFGLSEQEVMSGGNARKYCNPRHIMAYLLVNEYKITRSETSRLLEKDRATVYNSLSRAAGMMNSNKQFKNSFIAIKKTVEDEIKKLEKVQKDINGL